MRTEIKRTPKREDFVPQGVLLQQSGPAGHTGKGLAQSLRSVGLLPPPYFLTFPHS